MRRLLLLLVVLAAPASLRAADPQPDGKRWWSYVQYLADDKLEGRNTGSAGYRQAAAYVADHWKRAGLEPAGNSGFYQTVEFRSRRIREERSSLALIRNGVREPLALGDEAAISLRNEPPASLTASVVFVGYGLTVPEHHYDDLAGLDLKGKIVLYLSGGPASLPGELKAHYQASAERWRFLERAGVVGTIAVQNPSHMDLPWERSTLARLQAAMTLSESALTEIPAGKLTLLLNPARAERFFAGSGHTFQEILQLSDAGQPLPRFPLAVSLAAQVALETAAVDSPNVAAVWRGSDPKLRAEYVVLSAHLDHVGVGEPIHGDRIYNGAMDDASGIATLLEIATLLSESKIRTRRSILFVAVTAEEKGLLGSKYFAAHPTVKPTSMVANFNFDMFLPLHPLKILTVLGLDESDLGDRIREVARPLGLQLQRDPEPDRNIFIRSDQYNFIRHGVPALYFKLGYEKGSPQEALQKAWLKERYHAPSDDVNQPVNLQAAADFVQVMLSVTEATANRPARPQWHAQSFFRRFSATP
jgi:peptidase M28-like protein